MSTNQPKNRNEYVRDWQRQSRRKKGMLTMEERKAMRSLYVSYKLGSLNSETYLQHINELIQKNAP